MAQLRVGLASGERRISHARAPPLSDAFGAFQKTSPRATSERRVAHFGECRLAYVIGSRRGDDNSSASSEPASRFPRRQIGLVILFSRRSPPLERDVFRWRSVRSLEESPLNALESPSTFRPLSSFARHRAAEPASPIPLSSRMPDRRCPLRCRARGSPLLGALPCANTALGDPLLHIKSALRPRSFAPSAKMRL